MNTTPTIDITAPTTRWSKEPELFMIMIGALAAGVMFEAFSVVAGAALLAGGIGIVLFTMVQKSAT